MKFLCIIPVFNEEKLLENLLIQIKSFTQNNYYNIEFLLINNGSTDSSLQIIKNSGLKFISLRKNRGVGYSLLLGLKIGWLKKFDVLIHLAGNNKMSPFDIPNIIEPIYFKNFDFVTGTRFGLKKNYTNNPLFRKISIKILSKFFTFIFKKKITDATCGFRAFKIKLLHKNFNLFNKKKFYTYGYEYYSYGKILTSKFINHCEANIRMNYPKKGKYSKIRPFIDWYPIVSGYILAFFDKKIFKL
jgi:dolichol-phosphate mannosyltransferase